MNPILIHYYKCSNNIDVKDFDAQLIDCLNFYEHPDNSFEDYLSENKVIIDSNLFKQYLDLFVVINFGNHDSYKTIETRRTIKYTIVSLDIGYERTDTITDDFITSFLKAIRNNGYVLCATDLMYAPFICSMVNKIAELSSDEKINVKNYLYSNIELLEKKHILMTQLNDPELTLLSNLMSLQKINKQVLTNIYNNTDIKPNSSHLAVILNKLPNKQKTTAKAIIDFFDKYGVSAHAKMFRNFSTYSNKKYIINLLETKKSFSHLKHYDIVENNSDSDGDGSVDWDSDD